MLQHRLALVIHETLQHGSRRDRLQRDHRPTPQTPLNLLNGVKALRLDDIDRAQRHLNIKVTVRPR